MTNCWITSYENLVTSLFNSFSELEITILRLINGRSIALLWFPFHGMFFIILVAVFGHFYWTHEKMSWSKAGHVLMIIMQMIKKVILLHIFSKWAWISFKLIIYIQLETFPFGPDSLPYYSQFFMKINAKVIKILHLFVLFWKNS